MVARPLGGPPPVSHVTPLLRLPKVALDWRYGQVVGADSAPIKRLNCGSRPLRQATQARHRLYLSPRAGNRPIAAAAAEAGRPHYSALCVSFVPLLPPKPIPFGIVGGSSGGGNGDGGGGCVRRGPPTLVQFEEQQWRPIIRPKLGRLKDGAGGQIIARGQRCQLWQLRHNQVGRVARRRASECARRLLSGSSEQLEIETRLWRPKRQRPKRNPANLSHGRRT